MSDTGMLSDAIVRMASDKLKIRYRIEALIERLEREDVHMVCVPIKDLTKDAVIAELRDIAEDL